MDKTITIGDRLVGSGQPAYIIAEIGANHNGDLALAKKLIAEAKRVGCDCAKFQTFTADEFCADPDQPFTYKSQGQTVTKSMRDMFHRLEFSPEEWAEIVGECRKQQIQFMTTIQDPVDLKRMLPFGLPAIKVGSDDFDHIINLRRYAATGLPLIVSKGMADLGEVDRVIRCLRERTDKLIMLHCVSLYPTEPRFLNLRQIVTLNRLYPDIVWGFSDHSQGPLASTIAVALGAKVIEKHFTLSHDAAGPDHWFSMDVNEMAQLVHDVRFAESALGDGEVNPAPEELAARNTTRRRLVARADLAAGDFLTEDTVTFKRASRGSFICYWPLIEGYKIARPLKANEGIELGDVDFRSRATRTR
jgi:N,N'-diacetyllegionaminate synthase